MALPIGTYSVAGMGIEQPLPHGLLARRARWLAEPVDSSVRRTKSTPRVGVIAAGALVLASTVLVGIFVVRPSLSYALFVPLVVAAGLMLRGRLMATVTVEINGRPYAVGCADGQEERVRILAKQFDVHVRQVAGDVVQAVARSAARPAPSSRATAAKAGWSGPSSGGRRAM